MSPQEALEQALNETSKTEVSIDQADPLGLTAGANIAVSSMANNDVETPVVGSLRVLSRDRGLAFR